MQQREEQQDLQNQFALSNFQRAGLAGDVATQGNLGAFRQGLINNNYKQMLKQQELQLTNHNKDYLQYGGGITVFSGLLLQHQAPATASPFSTGLSTALGVAGLFGKL